MKKSLAIGIDNYPNNPLNGCVNDATEFASILKTHGDGSPNFDVRLKTNIQTKGEVRKLISELFSGDADSALFYFSGHGYLNEIGGWLVTPDHDEYDEGISMDDVLTLADNAKNIKSKTIILDCCNAGKMGSPNIAKGSAVISEGVSILTSSRDVETSQEVNGHGVFTNLLLDALRGGAADLRGHISPGSVYAYIDQALGPWDQRPVFKTNVTRFISLREITPQVPLETLRRLTKYFNKPQDQFQLDPSFEDTNSPDVVHEIKKPYAKPDKVAMFKDLQKLQSVGLVVPVNADYMYFAAMESKSCKLTSLGYHYWRLVKNNKI